MSDEPVMEQAEQEAVRQVNHRLNNILANVTAMANQAKRQTEDPVKALETLSDRICALSRIQTLLSTRPKHGASLAALLQCELEQVASQKQITLRGADLMLLPNAALTLSMAFYEMAANAAHHGSLQAGLGGTVDVNWRIVDRTDEDDMSGILIVDWVEKGGGCAVAPTALGFGLMLTTALIEGKLNGRVLRTFDSRGHQASLRMAVDQTIVGCKS